MPSHWSDLVKHATQLDTEEDFDLATSWAYGYISNKPVLVDEEDNTGAPILPNGNVQYTISEEA